MADTRLADAVVPEIFAGYMAKDTRQVQAFYQTGVLRPDGDLATKLGGGGRTFNVPFWKDLDDTESEVANDDPTDEGTPGKVSASTDIARRQLRTRGWSTMRLVAELAGDDPMARISARVGAYWGRQLDDVAISSVRGVFADNIANDSGDMVVDVSTDDAGTPTADNLFSAEAVMDAAQTMGDAKRDLKLIVMHSVVQTRLAKNDLITFRPDSEGKNWHEYFMDWRVHTSDRVPVITGTNQTMYHTYLFGADALGWAEVDPAVPVEVEPKPAIGNGMGGDILWTRRQFVIHPYGIKWTDSSVAGEFPTNAELALAANWDRVYVERKQIPMALLITNG